MTIYNIVNDGGMALVSCFTIKLNNRVVAGLYVARMSVRSSDPALYDFWCSAFVELYPSIGYRTQDGSGQKFVRELRI